MSTVSSGREIYVIGKEPHGDREVVIQEDASVHDLPAGQKYTYASVLTRFPYTLAA